MKQKFKALLKALKAYCMRKVISVKQLYMTVNGNKTEMNYKVFSKIVKHMDQDITDHEIDILYNVFDEDKSGAISC